MPSRPVTKARGRIYIVACEGTSRLRFQAANAVNELYKINPLDDPRWPELVHRHASASVFHTTNWSRALQRTYDYEPVVFTTSPPGRELSCGVLLSRVRSWITGSRLVSVSFADHCEPLAGSSEERKALLQGIAAGLPSDLCRYIELRPLSPDAGAVACASGFSKSASFHFHELDLRPDLDRLFAHLHKSCIQRNILRAEREGISYEAGNSRQLLDAFYSLLLLTRRRHGIPPQPRAWFANLANEFGGDFEILLASKDGAPAAAVVTLRFNNMLVYKYGVSDARYHKFGVMPALFWRCIQKAKALGLERFDLGRSDDDDEGLIQFKNRLGAAGRSLTYFRCPQAAAAAARPHGGLAVKKLVGYLPDSVFEACSLLYRHVG